MFPNYDTKFNFSSNQTSSLTLSRLDSIRNATYSLFYFPKFGNSKIGEKIWMWKFLLTCFHSSPYVCHFWLLQNGIPTNLLFSSANHPDNRLTIAWQATIWLTEYYDKKTRQSDSFSEILVFTKNQRYGQLLLISTNLNPKRSLVRSMYNFNNCLQSFVFYKASFVCF